MICRICLLESFESIGIFDDEGVRLKMAQIITQHFWFEPKNDDPISDKICNTCWWKIESFHTFYVSIEAAHEKLSRRFSVKQNTTLCNQSCYAEKTHLVISNDCQYLLPTENDFLEDSATEDNCAQMLPSPAESFCNNGEKVDTIYVVKKEPFIDGELENKLSTDNQDSLHQDDMDLIKVENLDNVLTTNRMLKTGNTAQKRKFRKTNALAGPILHQADSDKKMCSIKHNSKQRSTSPKCSEYLKKSKEDDEKITKYMKLKCDVCSQGFQVFAEIRKHYRTAHKRKGYVVCCNKKFYKRVLILDHINKHLNPEYFKCKECNKTFADKQCLRNHMLKHESDEIKIYKCDQCPRKYAKQYLLDQHKLTHMPVEERQHFCEECGKAFPTNNLLQTHRRYVHENAYGKMCHICAKVIRGKALFEKHQLEHDGIIEPRVQCQKCGAWLKHEYSLRKHMRRHLEALSEHNCNICGKITPSKGALRSHVRYVHSSARTFVCSVCNKAFKKAITLKEHMTTHTGEVLYTCPHCPKTFNSSANMHSHRKKVHRKEWEESRIKRGAPSVSLVAPNNIVSVTDSAEISETAIDRRVSCESLSPCDIKQNS